MTDGIFRILGRPSSINVRKVIWTAAEAGVPFVNEAEWGATRSVSSFGTQGDTPESGIQPFVLG